MRRSFDFICHYTKFRRTRRNERSQNCHCGPLAFALSRRISSCAILENKYGILAVPLFRVFRSVFISLSAGFSEYNVPLRYTAQFTFLLRLCPPSVRMHRGSSLFRSFPFSLSHSRSTASTQLSRKTFHFHSSTVASVCLGEDNFSVSRRGRAAVNCWFLSRGERAAFVSSLARILRIIRSHPTTARIDHFQPSSGKRYNVRPPSASHHNAQTVRNDRPSSLLHFFLSLSPYMLVE